MSLPYHMQASPYTTLAMLIRWYPLIYSIISTP